MVRKNLRIYMVSGSFLPTTGGLQYLLKYLTEAIANQDTEIFLLSYPDGNSFLDKSKLGYPMYIQIKKRNAFLEICNQYKLIKKISPDVIHVHGALREALLISILRFFRLIKQPLIVTSHGNDIMTAKEIGYGARLKPLWSLLVRFILCNVTKHVIVGDTMRHFAVDAGSRRDKVTKINNGVPIKDIKISKKEYNRAIKKYGIKPRDKVLLSLSGMRPLKGIEYLVEAMPVILRKFPQTKLLLACESDKYYERIRKLVSNLGLEGNIKFIGFITNVKEKTALIRRCDVFCKPSILEACSVAILEAMKEGRVVVASVPGGVDILVHRKNGLLTKVRDSNGFARAIIRVLSDRKLRKKLEKNAKKNIKNFDVKLIATKYIDLYKKLSMRYSKSSLREDLRRGSR